MDHSDQPAVPVCPTCGAPLGEATYCIPCLLGASLQDPAAYGPASALDDYEILEPLGQGAMGSVFRARKLSLRKIVALKFIKAGPGASERHRALFLREAELASQLDHPNIVSVSEIGEHQGTPFLAMRYVDGAPLAEYLARRDFLPLIAQRLRLLVRTIRAVHYAHQRGVIHRDLKPGNILVDTSGTPFVADFGLARWIDQDSTITFSEGVPFGTPAYMSPEQARGRAGDLTIASDIWSLGVMLYLLLAGHEPFRGPSFAAILREVLETDPPSPFHTDPSPPDPDPDTPRTAYPPSDRYRHSRAQIRDLESICCRCLEKDPQRRYATAQALADDLDRWLQGLPVTARRPSPRELLLRWSRRHPAAAALSVVSVVAVFALVGTVWQSVVNARTAQLQRSFNYVGSMSLAQLGLQRSNTVLYGSALRAVRQSLEPHQAPGIEWGLLEAVRASNLEDVWFDAGEPLLGVAVSPHSGEIATLAHHHLFRLDPKGTVLETKPWPSPDPPGGFAYSPDGRWLALAAKTGLTLFPLNGGPPLTLRTNPVEAIAFSADGLRLAGYCLAPKGEENTLEVLAIPRPDAIAALRVDDLNALAWTPNGSLRFCNAVGNLREWIPSRTNALPLTRIPYRSQTSVFTRHGSRILLTSLYGVVHLLDLVEPTPRYTQSFTGLPGDSARVAFAQDDRRWALTTVDGAVVVADADSDTNPPRTRLLGPGHTAAITGIAFSQDGEFVFTASNDHTLRRLPLDRPARLPYLQVENHIATLGGIPPTFSPDSRLVALLDSRDFRGDSQGDRTLIWNTQSRQLAGILPSGLIAWGPDHLALSWDYSGILRVWNLADPAHPRPLARFRLNPQHDNRVDSKLADRGRWVVSISTHGQASAFDVAHLTHLVLNPVTLKPGADADDVQFDYLATSPATPYVALGFHGFGTVLWDLRLKRVRQLATDTSGDISFTPDGLHLAVTDYQTHQLAFFNVLTGAPEERLSGHQGAVVALDFTPDGHGLVTGGNDYSMVVWNLATGREVFRQRFDASIAWVRVSPDTRWLVVGLLPNQLDRENKSLGSGRYLLWPVDRPNPVAGPATPPQPAAFPPDSIWYKYPEIARAFPAPE